MKQYNHINPIRDLGEGLLDIEKPNRYVGGEYGCLAKPEASLQTLIAFPDLYEIGMSNQALRILYNELNQIEGVSCDRAFAPAPDFEALLRKQGIPLYGLDTGISLGNLDILLFTLGYELGITGVLTMLEAGMIPIYMQDRTADAPIVILGGPCASNPLPYERFIDAFWIGEAEGGFFDLIRQVLVLKQAGQDRAGLLECIAAHPSVWIPGKIKVKRAIDTQFALRKARASVFPIPSMKVIQHHGAVEIMRGCPNGCRFCHAGYWYRPMRQKSAEVVRQEADAFITLGGYREISLSSLSTGDYQQLDQLIADLNTVYASRHISFQLPSLRVSTFSLPLLAKIAEVRKSGLTFAVETPVDAWQFAINKEVPRDNVTAILQEAKKRGWREAKFYFMIGLPVENETKETADPAQEALGEEEAIVDFILTLARRTGLRFHINIGTFVPKPHTPYQRAMQLDETQAHKKLSYIRSKLQPLGHKVGIQDPFISVLEGVISRGDSRVGALIEEAYRKGCRLDAWTEYLQKELWRNIFETHAPLVQEILGRKTPDAVLGWEAISSGIGAGYLHAEAAKSIQQKITSKCGETCSHPCGVCDASVGIAENSCQILAASQQPSLSPALPVKIDSDTWRILFTFTKQGTAIFQPHLALMEIFSMALLRAEVPAVYSQGFNPLPRLEIASPLSIGIEAAAEAAALDTLVRMRAEDFKEALNPRLPEGIRIKEALTLRIPGGTKKHSLASMLWGYTYGTDKGAPMDSVPAKEEKAYRLSKTGASGSVYGLIRHEVLAKQRENPMLPGSYFTVYQELYPE
ncbi:MAG: TIGR03960 family B12-binding radical SAM protein [Treponema sp.]|jgi:radical SAM family uncharacterized protein/radical SAM-linked protein|nr:TIGR03960 family B12-binding radical SAM protein [Treponema sp.]